MSPTQAEAQQAEAIRRAMIPQVNAPAAAARAEAAGTGRDPAAILREKLGAEHGAVYDTAEVQEHFEVLGFASPLVVVRRRADGVQGSLYFTHSPRLYYGFEAHRG